MITTALGTAWEWYYGSGEEQAISECEFREPYEFPESKNGPSSGSQTKNRTNEDRIVRRGKLSDGVEVNIFSIQLAKSFTNFENNVKFLKILRHPNIIRYLNHVATETESHLVTELATPLPLLLDKMDANEICSGLHDIAHAVKFLHSQAKVSHNNVSIGSIYVSEKGSWKLGDFDFASSFSECSKRNIFYPECYIKPSHLKKLPKRFDQKYAYCGDVNAFGLLLKTYKTQLQFATGLSSEKLTKVISDITRDDFEQRPTMAEILTMPVMKSAFIFIINFLQSITLKKQAEKEAFFQRLLQMATDSKIFAHVFAKCIVPLLLTPIVLAEQTALKHVIYRVLSPKNKGNEEGFIPDDIFAEFVIPKIVDLFKSRVLHVRMMLLETLDNFVHLFEKSILEEFVLPEIILGMSDSNNELVKATLIALAQTIPVVGGDVIVGCERERHFSHATPKFNGNMLNEQSVLVDQEIFPTRKPLPAVPKIDPNKSKKPTLLEIAQRGRDASKLTNLRKMEIMEKQKLLATAMNRKPISLFKKKKEVEAEEVVDESALERSNSPAVAQVEKEVNQIITNKEKQPPSSPTLLDKLDAVVKKEEKVTKIVTKINDEIEVETWASSDENDEDEEDGWEDFDDFDPVDEEEEEEAEDNNKEEEEKKVLSPSIDESPTVMTKTPCNVDNTAIMFEDELGSEFVIKPKAPAISAEPDYFADMEPTISSESPQVSPRGGDVVTDNNGLSVQDEYQGAEMI